MLKAPSSLTHYEYSRLELRDLKPDHHPAPCSDMPTLRHATSAERASEVQDRAREGKAKGAAATALACAAVSAGGSDTDRLRALRALAGLWLTHRGADLEAALRGWTLVLTTVDVRTLSTPLIDATLHHLAEHLAVRPPPPHTHTHT